MLNKRGQEVKHIKEDDLKRIREFLKLKNKVVLLNSSVQKSLKELKIYYRSIGYSSTEGYIFKSLSRCNKKYLIDSPLTNNAVSKDFNKIKDMLNTSYPIGSHSLRKLGDIQSIKKLKILLLL